MRTWVISWSFSVANSTHLPILFSPLYRLRPKLTDNLVGYHRLPNPDHGPVAIAGDLSQNIQVENCIPQPNRLRIGYCTNAIAGD